MKVRPERVGREAGVPRENSGGGRGNCWAEPQGLPGGGHLTGNYPDQDRNRSWIHSDCQRRANIHCKRG